jgi:hypothetical protein
MGALSGAFRSKVKFAQSLASSNRLKASAARADAWLVGSSGQGQLPEAIGRSRVGLGLVILIPRTDAPVREAAGLASLAALATLPSRAAACPAARSPWLRTRWAIGPAGVACKSRVRHARDRPAASRHPIFCRRPRYAGLTFSSSEEIPAGAFLASEISYWLFSGNRKLVPVLFRRLRFQQALFRFPGCRGRSHCAGRAGVYLPWHTPWQRSSQPLPVEARVLSCLSLICHRNAKYPKYTQPGLNWRTSVC